MSRGGWVALLLVAACHGAAPAPVAVAPPAPSDAGPPIVDAPPAVPTPILDAYRATADQIIAHARADRGAFTKLAFLTDHIGHRLAGSPQLDQAIAWAKDALAADGHAVTTEPVMVPHWQRGAERAQLVAPIARELVMLGLGGSVGTPPGGITAPVVVVHGWDELAARAADVKGAIVLYDVAMPAWTEAHGSGYGDVVPFRVAGAIAAAKLGAVAVLMRSVTAHSLRSPHTGAMRYVDGVPRIPAAAITVEDAALIARLAAAGPVRVALTMGARSLPEAPSANVIAELRGRERPDEIVVIGAHLDSWDVGQGAHDDGAGVVHVMQALTTLRALGLTPRRTIRVVLFTNEENGLRGGKGYAAAHGGDHHVALLETDNGGFAPRGFRIQTHGDVALRARLDEAAQLLAPLGATTLEEDDADADVSPLVEAGALGLGLAVDGRTYFDVHHTAADTLDKVDPQVLADGVAAIAVMAYVLADAEPALAVTAPAAAPAP
ncbi:MAG: M20/M25/M40 family metallo-hydrolase [Myxococcales bacterium]|nr:M20/M25/M40 family metallo-hydrolase [Myxococcales bacterium]